MAFHWHVSTVEHFNSDPNSELDVHYDAFSQRGDDTLCPESAEWAVSDHAVSCDKPKPPDFDCCAGGNVYVTDGWKTVDQTKQAGLDAATTTYEYGSVQANGRQSFVSKKKSVNPTTGIEQHTYLHYASTNRQWQVAWELNRNFQFSSNPGLGGGVIAFSKAGQPKAMCPTDASWANQDYRVACDAPPLVPDPCCSGQDPSEDLWVTNPEGVSRRYKKKNSTINDHDVWSIAAGEGTRLPQLELKATKFQKYVGYTGKLGDGITGAVKVAHSAEDGSLIVSFDLSRNDAGTLGGIHINAGKDCNSDAGAHWWNNSSDVVTDPWTTATDPGGTYTTGKDKTAKGSFTLKSGYTYADNIGHVVVIHDITGKKIACGVLVDSPYVAQGSTLYFASRKKHWHLSSAEHAEHHPNGYVYDAFTDTYSEDHHVTASSLVNENRRCPMSDGTSGWGGWSITCYQPPSVECCNGDKKLFVKHTETDARGKTEVNLQQYTLDASTRINQMPVWVLPTSHTSSLRGKHGHALFGGRSGYFHLASLAHTFGNGGDSPVYATAGSYVPACPTGVDWAAQTGADTYEVSCTMFKPPPPPPPCCSIVYVTDNEGRTTEYEIGKAKKTSVNWKVNDKSVWSSPAQSGQPAATYHDHALYYARLGSTPDTSTRWHITTLEHAKVHRREGIKDYRDCQTLEARDPTLYASRATYCNTLNPFGENDPLTYTEAASEENEVTTPAWRLNGRGNLRLDPRCPNLANWESTGYRVSCNRPDPISPCCSTIYVTNVEGQCQCQAGSASSVSCAPPSRVRLSQRRGRHAKGEHIRFNCEMCPILRPLACALALDAQNDGLKRI